MMTSSLAKAGLANVPSPMAAVSPPPAPGTVGSSVASEIGAWATKEFRCGCISERQSCGGCGDPCNSISDYNTSSIFLQSAAGS